jgi:hypothetical protein
MADEFDSSVAATNLAQLVTSTSAAVREVVPTSLPAPLFHTLQDGTVTDDAGRVIRGPIAPLPAKP